MFCVRLDIIAEWAVDARENTEERRSNKPVQTRTFTIQYGMIFNMATSGVCCEAVYSRRKHIHILKTIE